MRVLVGAVLVTAATAAVGDAQQPVVSIAVSVASRSGGEPVAGLTAADFRVFEDGVEQPVASVSAGPGPVSVAVVLDRSDPMAGRPMELAQRSIEHLVAALTPQEEIALVTCARVTTVAVPWTGGDTFPKLDWALWKTIPVSELLQGVYQGLGLMNEARHARRALLVVSSAEQAASTYGLRNFVRSRRESETGMYGLRTTDLLSAAAGIGGPRPGAPQSATTIWESRGALTSFDDLVRDSGGLVLPARSTPEADRSVNTLLTGLRNQYVLTFTPKRPADDTYRRLKVELRHGGHKLRYTTGYLAKPD